MLFYRVHISIGINDDFLKSYLLISYIIFSSRIRDKYTPTFTLLYRKGENNSKSHKKNQKKRRLFQELLRWHRYRGETKRNSEIKQNMQTKALFFIYTGRR